MTKGFYKTIQFSLLLVLILISSFGFSQEKTIHFGLSFNARITHQNFDDSDKNRSDDEFSYAITGNIYFDLSSKFQLISGLSFSHYKINQLDDFPVFLCDIDPSQGYIPFNSYFKENYKTNYLGIPLEGRWIMGNKANPFFLQFGFEGLFKIALNEKYTLVECNGASEIEIDLPVDSKEVNDFLLLAKLGVGYEFPINEKMKLFFEPNIEYSLTSFFKYGIGIGNFFNFGLNTGIRF